MPSYDRDAATNYAMRWALGRNPAYPNFSSQGPLGGGGDCANFISQALHAGGWPMIDGWSRRSYAWWAEPGKASRSWSSASWFSDYIEETKKAKICLRQDLHLGDIVTLHMQGKHVMHIMMITGKRCGKGGDELLFSAHSTDRLNHPLAEVEYELKDAGRTFLYWKVAKTIMGGMGIWDKS